MTPNDDITHPEIEYQETRDDFDFDDAVEKAVDELNNQNTIGFITAPYQRTEDSFRTPVVMSVDNEVVTNPKEGFDLFTEMAGISSASIAQNFGLDLSTVINAIEYKSRVMSGENDTDVRHEFSWNVKTPTVYRYLDQKYIDKFFDEGILRLSSFAKFAEHDDEMRKDGREGNNALFVETVDNKTLFAPVMYGEDSYILSGSTIESESLMEDFGVNGYFKITDTSAFGEEIAKAIEKIDSVDFVKGGIEGYCKYNDWNKIEKKVDFAAPEELQEENVGKDIPLEKIVNQIRDAAGADPLFVKNKEYQEQSEYRWVWSIEGEVEKTIEIECPEALEYCEKVT